MVSTRRLISKFTSPCINGLVIVPKATVTMSNTVTYIILLIWEFFTLALADGLPLESDWQQVSSSSLSILADQNNL